MDLIKLYVSKEEEIQHLLKKVVKLLYELDADDWAMDIDATAYSLHKEFEEERKFKNRFGCTKDEFFDDIYPELSANIRDNVTQQKLPDDKIREIIKSIRKNQE